MRLSRLFLAVCLLAVCLLGSLACDHDSALGTPLFNIETLTITVMTVGENLDADGYTLSTTGVAEDTIGINETKVFTVLVMEVTVELLDVAANCTVDNNPQTVDVNSPTTVIFVVECS